MLTDNPTPGSPTQDGDSEAAWMNWVNTFAAVGGAILLAAALWKFYKTGEV